MLWFAAFGGEHTEDICFGLTIIVFFAVASWDHIPESHEGLGRGEAHDSRAHLAGLCPCSWAKSCELIRFALSVPALSAPSGLEDIMYKSRAPGRGYQDP